MLYTGARPLSREYPSVCFDRVVMCEVGACTTDLGSPEWSPLGVQPFAGDELLTGLAWLSTSFYRLVVV